MAERAGSPGKRSGTRSHRGSSIGAKPPPIRRKSRTGAVQPPVTRSQRLELTRDSILQSALEHFARYGFDGASLRDIAAAAGVNHGMIRHIYGSKDEVWREAIAFLFERLDREVNLDQEIQAGMDDRKLFATYVHRYVRYCARHPEHARIMIQQSSRSGAALKWATSRFIRARHRVAGPVIERLQAAGDLPDVDPWSLAFSVAASCQMFFVLAPEVHALCERDVFQPEEIERHAAAVVDIFLRPKTR